MKRLEVFLLPLDGMLVHRKSLPRNFARFPQQFAGTHLYTWVERGTVRVKCLAQEHNTMSPARARTWTARSRVKRTNHEATVPALLCGRYIYGYFLELHNQFISYIVQIKTVLIFFVPVFFGPVYNFGHPSTNKNIFYFWSSELVPLIYNSEWAWDQRGYGCRMMPPPPSPLCFPTAGCSSNTCFGFCNKLVSQRQGC